MGLAVPAFAGPVSTSSVTGEGVLVEAPAQLPQTLDPTASVTIVSPRRLERAKARGDQLSRVLDEVVGVRVLDFGGPGAQQQLTLRGGAPTQALVVVDGMPLRTPFARGFDVGLVHPETLEHVEVARGGQGAAWGDGALTGVLALRSRMANGRPIQAATIGGGSFGTARLSGIVSGEALGAALTYERTRGDFGYVSRLVGLPDEARVRQNNDAQRVTFGGAARTDLEVGRLEARLAGAYRTGGVAGLADTPGESLVAREQTWHGRAHLGWQRGVDWADGGDLRCAAHVALLDLAYQDPALQTDTRTRFASGGFDADLTLGFLESHLLRVTLFSGGEGLVSAEAPARFRFALGGADEWIRGALSLTGALRLEVVSGQRIAVLPRLGAAYEVARSVVLTAAVGRSLRTPTLDELYHPPQVAFSGNPDLRSEQAWEAEVGARLRSGFLTAQLVGFARSIDEVILYLNRDAFRVRPENVSGAAHALGLEAAVAWEYSAGPVRLYGDLQGSLLASRLEETGARMPTQPIWTFAAVVGGAYGRLDLDTTLRGVGPTFVNLRPNDQNRVPTYLRWDVAARVMLADEVALGLELRNVLDQRTLASVNRFPLPGRAFFGSLRVRFEETGVR